MKQNPIQKKLFEFLSAIYQMTKLAWKFTPLLLVGIIVLTILMGLEPIAAAWISKEIFDLADEMANNTFVHYNYLLLLLCARVSVEILYSLCKSLESFFTFKVNNKLSLDTRTLVYAKIGSLHGLKYFEDKQFYNLVQLSIQGAQAGPAQIIHIFITTLRSLIVLISFSGVLFALDSTLALAVFFVSIPQLWVRHKLTKQSIAVTRSNTPESRKRSYFERVLYEPSFVKEMKLFNLSEFFLEAFKKSYMTIFRKEENYKKYELRTEGILNIVIQVTNTVALGIVLLRVVNGILSIGDLVLYIQAINSVQIALQSLIFSATNLTSGVMFFNYYQQLLSLPSTLFVTDNPQPVPPLQHEIRLCNVSFRYSSEQPWVIRNCDLTIAKGQIIGLVGLNGVGKSTLAKLLLRFYDPTEGKILWDGIDIREFDVKQYRDHLSAIFQDFIRYDLTVKKNIGVGDVSGIENLVAIRRAALKVGAHGFISHLPKGYNTTLSYWLSEGEGSVDISGGQWQKIANARSLMRDADFLILDEPTANLDVEAEFKLYSEFQKLTANKTTLLISHRFSTLSMADCIAILEDGRIVEFGTHEYLMALRGKYKKLFDLQTNRP